MRGPAALLVRLVLWAVPAVLLVYAGTLAMRPTSVDEHYVKLSSGETVNGLLIGSSRMSQGVDPERVFANTGFEGSVLNFAFTNVTSPYGEVYNRAILKRARGVHNGVFVLEVNPWIFARDRRETVPRETGRTLDGLVQLSGHPNLDYLVRKTKRQWYQACTGPEHPLYPEASGWLHVDLDWSGLDMDSTRHAKLERYRVLEPHYVLDSTRLRSFEVLVSELRKRGQVVGLELPVSSGMAEIEQRVFPAFESWISDLQGQLPIVRLRDSVAYVTHDGNHLMRASAEELSAWLNRTGLLLNAE